MTQAAQAASSAQTSGVNGLLNLISSKSPSNSQSNLADQFKALLQELADGQTGQTGQTNLTPAQLAELLSKQQSSTQGAALDAGQLQTKLKALLAADGQHDDDDMSAALISEVAALMQKYPALQPLFTPAVDADQLAAISADLTKAAPDFSDLKLSGDLKSELTALSGDAEAKNALQDITAQLTANSKLTAELPQALEAFSKLVNQNGNSQALLASINPTNAANVTAADANPKLRPQGLLKSLDAEQQTLAQQNGQVQVAAGADAQAADSQLQTALQNNNQAAAAAPDADKIATQSFFALPTNEAELANNFTANQANAIVQTGVSNIYLAGAVDAASAAQQTTVNAAANPAVMQVAIQMQRNAQVNNNDFTMQLYPAELGRIQVAMKFDGNKVQTKISADKEETLAYLKQDQGTLSRALQAAGLQTDAGSMEFSLSNSGQQFAGQSQKNNSDNAQFGTLLATNNADETSGTSAGSNQWLTLEAGRVDVKL